MVKVVRDQLYHWSDTAKLLKLPILIEGEALTVWFELSEKINNYSKASNHKMMPQSFVLQDNFHKHTLHPGEPISVYVHELKFNCFYTNFWLGFYVISVSH